MHGTAGCIGYRRGDRSSRDRRQACATEAASRTREICELIRDPPRGRSRRNPRRCKSPRGCRCVIARRHTYLIGPHLRFAGNASARIGKIIALTQRHDPQTMDTFRASASLICTKAPIALPRARRPRAQSSNRQGRCRAGSGCGASGFRRRCGAARSPSQIIERAALACARAPC